MQKLVVTVDELASMAGISPRQVWREVKHGHLPPPIYAGTRQARWATIDAERWLARRNGQAPPQPQRPPDPSSAGISLADRSFRSRNLYEHFVRHARHDERAHVLVGGCTMKVLLAWATSVACILTWGIAMRHLLILVVLVESMAANGSSADNPIRPA